MTSETRWIAEPSDVLLIEMTCKACGASLALNPSKENHFIPRECPNCRDEWMPQESVLHQATRAIFRALRTLGEMEKESRFKLRLQLRQPMQSVFQRSEQAQ